MLGDRAVISAAKYSELGDHPFVQNAFSAAADIHKKIVKPTLKIEAEYTREPNEREYYFLAVGEALAHLLTAMQQMEHSVYYLSSFSPTKTMKEAGITRAAHLLWAIENYILRTQTIYDRALVLVDRVFHIQNDPQQVTHQVIVTNIHVKRTKVPVQLKRIRKAVQDYREHRNEIAHRAQHLDERLRHIELLSLFAMSGDLDTKNRRYLEEDLRYDIRDFVRVKKSEYRIVNQSVCESLGGLFSECEKIFKVQWQRIPEV